MKLVPEWYQHEFCLIAWPCNNELYTNILPLAKLEVAKVIFEISKNEKVIIVCNDKDQKEIDNFKFNKNITKFICPLDDSWMRDIAPIFYLENKELKSINFNFNGYGKYENFAHDNRASELISNYLNIPSLSSNITLEGGAITYDDKENLFTTSNVIFNKNRNQKKSKIDILKELKKLFEIKNIFLFDYGLINDDTDGHIDNIFCPIENNKYLIAGSSKINPNYEILKKNKFDIIEFFNNTNQEFEIIEIPLPSNKIINQKKITGSYINFYFSKNKIILPSFNVKEDNEIYSIFKDIFPQREIVMIETSNINYGGGNIHCITMNVPKYYD